MRNVAKKILRCKAVVDYKFYQRHPEVKGRKIRSDELDYQQEWWDIRNKESGCS